MHAVGETKPPVAHFGTKHPAHEAGIQQANIGFAIILLIDRDGAWHENGQDTDITIFKYGA